MASRVILVFLVSSLIPIFGQDHQTTLISTSTTQSTPQSNPSQSQTQSASQSQTATSTQQSPTPQSDAIDSCVDSAKKNLQSSLNLTYPQFQSLTNNLTSPRDFYQKLFNQSFTKDSYLQYCSTYRTGRAELDKCGNTTSKTLALIQYTFPDYVCNKRVNEYSDAMQCLESVNNNADAPFCRTNCSANEQNSINAKNPPANATRDQLIGFAVGDCIYTRCMADCRKKILEKTCNQSSEMELEALKVALSSAQTITDSLSALHMAASYALQDIFPTDCRNSLASITLRVFNGIGTDYLTPVINGTYSLFQSIQGNAPAAVQGAAGTTKNPGGGGESISKCGFSFSIVVALVLAKVF